MLKVGGCDEFAKVRDTNYAEQKANERFVILQDKIARNRIAHNYTCAKVYHRSCRKIHLLQPSILEKTCRIMKRKRGNRR